MLEKLRNFAKSIATVLFYVAVLASGVYAIWFAIKNSNNGNNFLVNLMIGLIDGIIRFLSFILTNWIENGTKVK